jgi:hypothetical protein
MFTLSIKGHWQPAHSFASCDVVPVLRSLLLGCKPHAPATSANGGNPVSEEAREQHLCIDATERQSKVLNSTSCNHLTVQGIVTALVNSMPLSSALNMLQVCRWDHWHARLAKQLFHKRLYLASATTPFVAPLHRMIGVR